MEETWELAVVSEEQESTKSRESEAKKTNLSKGEFRSENMRSKRQRRIALSFLASLFWLTISLTFYYLADQELPRKLLPILFDESGALEVARLLAFLSAIVSLLAFTVGYFSLISSAGLVKSLSRTAELTAGLSNFLSVATIGVSLPNDKADADESEDGSSLGDYSAINFPLAGEHQWQEPIVSASIRLQVEQDRLATRSSNTLIWGIVISTFAVGFLFWIIFTQDRPVPKDFLEFWFYYGPRFTLVVLVGLLSSFFLRLHVSAEREISRVRDEITNLELRLSSGLMAHQEGDLSTISTILSVEDRNLVNNPVSEASASKDIIISKLFDKISTRLGVSND